MAAPPQSATVAAPPQAQQLSHASASLYAGNLASDVTEAMLFEIFNQVGAVASIRVCRDAVTRRSLGYAYINYHNVSDAERALDTLAYNTVKDRALRIMWSQRDPSLRKSGVGNIFIKNLDKSIGVKQLHDTFSAFGNILSCKVVTDEHGHSRGYGFVHYESQDHSDQAIAKVNGMLLNGKKVFVGRHQSKKERPKNEGQNLTFCNVFVKNLDEAVTEAELQKAFGAHGDITSCVVMRDETQKSRGFGFINFKSHAAAEKACEALNETAMKEKKIFVGRAQKKIERSEELARKFEQMKIDRLNKYEGVNLYIKNLDDSVDDEKLRQEFTVFGTITSAKIATDDKDNSKGFGFVCFSSSEEATKAVTEMSGRMMGTKPIYVALAQRKEVRKQQLEAQYAQRTQMRLAQQTGSGLVGAPMYSGQPMFYPNMPQQVGGRAQPFVGYPPMMRPRWPQQGQQGRPAGYPSTVNTYAGPGRNRTRPNPGGVPNQRAGANSVPSGQPANMQNQQRRTSYKYTNNVRNQTRAEVGVPAAGVPAAASMVPGPEPLTAAALAALQPEQQKQMLGERIFMMVQTREPDLAGKITGMLLEMDNSELLHLLESPEGLSAKVDEAMAVLRAHNAVSTTQATEGEEKKDDKP